MKKIIPIIIGIVIVSLLLKITGIYEFENEWQRIVSFVNPVFATLGIIDESEEAVNNSSFNFESEKQQFSEKQISQWKEKDLFYLELISKQFQTNYFKQTLQLGDYIYLGEMKNRKPDGKGYILTVCYTDMGKKVFAPLYIGTFKNGTFNGYGKKFGKVSEYYHELTGMEYSTLDEAGVVYMEYEGYFTNGKFNGKGNYRIIDETVADDGQTINLNNYVNRNKATIENFLSEFDKTDLPLLISDLPVLDTYIAYTGEFKNDQFSGNGKVYNNKKQLIFKGRMKNNMYYGKGKLYYDNGRLKYEGEFKDGKYNGIGTLYKDDGSIEYSGKWNFGNIK